MRQRFIKALSLAISLITLLSALLLPASAAYVAPIINPMLDTYVVDDLVKMQYDPINYPLDPSATHLQLIHFLEYGYSRTDSRYYGLYIYLYNPTGKELELEGSYLQMSYGLGSKDYSKYPLSVVSYSIDTGNKFVFYKLKVNGINNVWRNINYASRVYNLANLELLYKGETEVVTKSWEQNAAKTRKNVWTYTGFQKGFGSNTEAGTLCYNVDELDTIPVTMHDASWMSDTSSLGEDYRWEVKSYYFNIPYSYIQQYGDPLDVQKNGTDGLYSVQGEYYKYGVNGLIVPDQVTYDKFLPSTNYYKFPENIVLDWEYFYGGGKVESDPNGIEPDKIKDGFSFNVPINTEFGSTVYPFKVIPSVNLIIYNLLSIGNSVSIDNAVFNALWKSSGKPIISKSSHMYIGDKTTNIGECVEFDVKVTDGDLGAAIHTYSERNEWGSLNWLHRLFNKDLYTDKENYSDCMPLVQINLSDVSAAFKDSVQGKKLYLDYDSYTKLQEFYSEMSPKLSNGFQANNVYLMRLSVEPYYESDVNLSTGNNGFYYEKVIHKNVDIFSFTFQRADGSFVTVPVDCDPVDNLGSVVEGNNKDDSNPNKYPDDPSPGEIIFDGAKKLLDWFNTLKGIVILTGITLGSIFIFAFVIIFWKYLEPWFQRAGKLLGVVGRGLGGFFGFIGKLFFGVFKAVWNIAVLIGSIFFPPIAVLRIDSSVSFGSSNDSKYYYEDRTYKQSEEKRKQAEENRKQAEERRKQERHEAELKDMERRSKSNNSSAASQKKDPYSKERKSLKEAIEEDKSNHAQWRVEKSYDTDEFIQAAIERTYREIK